MKYFLQRDGRSFGPYSIDDLKRYQSEGRIGPNDQIRPEDSERWVPQLEFFNPPAPAPQAPAAPVFTPPAAPQPSPFSSPTDSNPVWNPSPAPAPAPQPSPFGAPGGFGSPQPPQGGGFGAPPAPQGGFGAPGGFGGASGGFTPQPPQGGGFGSSGGFGQQPPQGGFGGPPQGGFGAPQPGAAPMGAPGSGPIPPDMHWALVLVISMVCGLFTIYWIYNQMTFVKKIDPASTALKKIFTGWAIILCAVVIGSIFTVAMRDSILAAIGGLIMFVGEMAGIVMMYIGIFNARTSLERYYNTVENIGLKLSPVMTFFFSVYYFQYHFARIANWKKTGRLV